MSYFLTYTGKRIDISNIDEKDVCLVDLANHLTKVCRYGGSLPLDTHYSVARHSINLAYYALNKTNKERVPLARYLLLHDASEYILGDMVKDIKNNLPDYQKLEDDVQNLILNKYGVVTTPYILKKAKELDTRILLNEARALYPLSYYLDFTGQLPNMEPLDFDIALDDIYRLNKTKEEFIEVCKMLGITDEIGDCYEHA